MARLPSVGGDSDAWGTILNEYLQVSHTSEGSLKPVARGFATVADLVADTTISYDIDTSGSYEVTVGDILEAGGFRYEVAASGAALGSASGEYQVVTAGGVKLIVLQLTNGEWNVQAFGALGDNSTDDSATIQRAIDVCAINGGTVRFSDGIYQIGSTLTLYSHVSLQGPGPDPAVPSPNNGVAVTEIKARSGVTTMIILDVGSETVAYTRGASIHNLRLNGNNIAVKGVNISDSVMASIRGCTFEGFTAADPVADIASAIYGGGVLYPTIQLNAFLAGNYYAFHSQTDQSAYSVYYGTNVGDFDKNNVNAKYGVLFEGILNFTNNAFEFDVEGRAAIDINSTNNNSYCSIIGNYFELGDGGGADFVAILCEKMSGSIHDNRIYGDPGVGTAIKLDESYNYSIDIRGNQLTYWDVGIAAQTPGNGNANNGRVCIGPNAFTNVNTRITGGPDFLSITSSANNGVDAQPSQYVQDLEHHSFSGGLYLGAVKYGEVDTISLRKGNIFKFLLYGGQNPVTISTINHAEPGQRFSMMALRDGEFTLDDTVFNLACGTDFELPANIPLLFEVDADSTVHEVGRTSALLTDVSAPSDTGTVVGWIEVAPGKKIPYYQ